MKPATFPLVSNDSPAKPRSRRAAAKPVIAAAGASASFAGVSLASIYVHAISTPSKLQDALSGADWTPADTFAIQSLSLAVSIGLVHDREKRGTCDPQLRESLMGIKLQIDRLIRSCESDGIYRKATADMPLDLD